MHACHACLYVCVRLCVYLCTCIFQKNHMNFAVDGQVRRRMESKILRLGISLMFPNLCLDKCGCYKYRVYWATVGNPSKRLKPLWLYYLFKIQREVGGAGRKAERSMLAFQGLSYNFWRGIWMLALMLCPLGTHFSNIFVVKGAEESYSSHWPQTSGCWAEGVLWSAVRHCLPMLGSTYSWPATVQTSTCCAFSPSTPMPSMSWC